MGTVMLQQAVVFQQAVTSPSWVELVSDVLRTAFALSFVCALAWIALRFAASRGLGKNTKSARLELVERLALDAQRSLVIVRVEQRRLLIGVGTGAAPQLVAELDGNGASVAATSVLSTDEMTRIQDAVRRDATH